MFTLQDGREHLYQWDLDRYIVVNDATICEVHFCNRTSDCSLVVEVKDGLAAIPNILLQDARPIRAYAYCDDKYTLTEQQFTVKSRTKPSDYQYEETTVIRIDVLLDKAEEAINLAEQSAQHADKTAKDLYDYIDTHTLDFTDDGEGNVTLEAIIPEGGEVNLDNYYTKLETDTAISTAIADIDIPDVTGFAKLEDIPTIPENVSSFNNDAGYLTEHQSLEGYATEKYVDDAIANIDIPEADVDLSNYYTKAETDAAIDKAIEDIDIPTGDLSGYATKTYVDDADKKHTQDIANLTFHIQNIIEPTITGKADKSHKHTISDITDYTAPDMSNYYTKAQTNAAIEEAVNGIEIPEPDLTPYATQQFVLDKVADIDIPEVPANISAFNNDAGYLTEHQSLEGYAKLTDIPTNYLTEVPAEYITETELAGKGYLTEHQSLEGYAKTTDIPDVSKYQTADQVTALINEALSGIATAEGGSY